MGLKVAAARPGSEAEQNLRSLASYHGPQELYELVERFNVSRVKHDLMTLCSKEFEGRRFGTRGHDRAQAWLHETMRQIGLNTTIFRIPSGVSMQELIEPPTLESLDGEGKIVRSFKPRLEFAVHPRSSDCSEAVGPVKSWQGDSPAGSWVVLEGPRKGLALDQLVYSLSQQSALGLIVPQNPRPQGYLAKVISSGPPVALPVIFLRRDILSSLQRQRIRVTIRLRRALARGGMVLGHLPGTDESLVNHPLLIGAHYDGVGDDPGIRIPGAADNAAGVAVVLETARILTEYVRQPRRPLTFGAFDGEEVGALGSRTYAHFLKGRGTTPLVLNLDGAARFGEAIWVEAGPRADELVAALDMAGRWLEIPMVLGPVGSDSRQYAKAGFPSVGVSLGGGGHTPSDVPEEVEASALKMAGKILLATAWQIASFSS